jgi:predicted nicotinamide N-methyase
LPSREASARRGRKHAPGAPIDQAIARLDEIVERRFRVAHVSVTLPQYTVQMARPENSDDLITEADFVKDERLPYWADIWPSAVVLAGTIASLDGAGRRLMELGCGAGLVTSAAVRAGFDVTATDYYEDALLFARLNALRNGGAEPAVAMLDWRHLPERLGPFDVVVASDVLYEQSYPGLIARTIARALGADGFALIADPGRIAAPDFPPACEAHGLVVADRIRIPFDEGEIHQTIDVLTIRRGGSSR